jgi:protease II
MADCDIDLVGYIVLSYDGMKDTNNIRWIFDVITGFKTSATWLESVNTVYGILHMNSRIDPVNKTTISSSDEILIFHKLEEPFLKLKMEVTNSSHGQLIFLYQKIYDEQKTKDFRFYATLLK